MIAVLRINQVVDKTESQINKSLVIMKRNTVVLVLVSHKEKEQNRRLLSDSSGQNVERTNYLPMVPLSKSRMTRLFKFLDLRHEPTTD